MEARKATNLLNTIALIAEILPYYGWTHEYFLVLSQLWKKTRNKLNEFFKEFRKIMGKNLIIFKISGRNINNIFPPSELFAFEADIEEVKDVKKFLQFLKRLKSEKKVEV